MGCCLEEVLVVVVVGGELVVLDYDGNEEVLGEMLICVKGRVSDDKFMIISLCWKIDLKNDGMDFGVWW